MGITSNWTTTWAVSTPDLPELPKVLRLFKTNKEIQKFLKEYDSFKLDYQYIKGYVKGTDKNPQYDWHSIPDSSSGTYNVPYIPYVSTGSSTTPSTTSSLGMHPVPGAIYNNKINGVSTDAIFADESDYKSYQQALMAELKDLKKLSKKQ